MKRRWFRAASGLLLVSMGAVAACDAVIGLGPEPTLEKPTEPVACTSVSDCVDSECKKATGCVEGECVFEAEPEGKRLAEQPEGGCTEVVCDGAGGQKSRPIEGCPCAAGTTIPCYEGLAGTEGTGQCKAGSRTCNANGFGYGQCDGQVLPGVEVCDPGFVDEDCDGQVNEEGANCKCGDGVVSAGEQCDDGNSIDEDGCTSDCVTFRKVEQISAGGYFTCALTTENAGAEVSRSVKCWGKGQYGCLGNNSTSNVGSINVPMSTELKAISFPLGTTVKAIGTGQEHACAVLENADNSTSAQCWGRGTNGQIGNQTTLDTNPIPHDVFFLPGVELPIPGGTSFGLGASHSCMLATFYAQDQVTCWGQNNNGQLGIGVVNTPTVPNLTIIATQYSAKALAAGSDHTCVLLHEGRVKCWGYNGFGQLGLGDTEPRGITFDTMGDYLPVVSLGGVPAKAIAAGDFHTCALLVDGAVKCWGDNGYGQLGLGDLLHRGDQTDEMGDNLPVVDLGGPAEQIAAGGYHTCALLDGGIIKCWGRNGAGQLGQGDNLNRGETLLQMGTNLKPVDLGDVKAVAVTVGSDHTCAILADGSVKCWGSNAYGQLGLDLPTDDTRGDAPGEMGASLPRVKLFDANW